MTDAPVSSSRLPAIVLTLLLLMLALRLTSAESLRETIVQKAARMDAELHPSPDNSVASFIGPIWITGYASLACLLAGAAACLAAARGAMVRMQFLQAVFIGLIAAVLLASGLHAANRFDALVGVADIMAGMLGAWAVALLVSPALLAREGGTLAFAAIIAILAVTAAKGLMQHFVEYPDLARYVHEHTEEALRRAGITDDPVQRKLFLSRVDSAEVSGFGALSNVFATQMIALLALVTAMIAAAIPRLKNAQVPAEEPARSRSNDGPGDKNLDYASQRIRKSGAMQPRQPGQIPIEFIAFGSVCIVLVATLAVIPMTQSKGGTACAGMALAAILLGAWLRRWIVPRRRRLLVIGVLCAVLGAAVTLGYGIAHHGLPSKSLLFRWQYWTATVPIIEQSPALGVGLNNFGDYYLRYKSPSFPEDVKDPHNFLVRLAAEAGIPAMVLIAALLVWLLIRALHPPAEDQEIKKQKSKITNAPPLLLAALLAIIWIPLHLLAEGDDPFTLCITILYAIIGWSVFAAVFVLLDFIAATPGRPLESPPSPRFIALAGIVAAVCMLLYDQVNMALVTGPAALLFWLLLALGGASSPAKKAAGTILALIIGLFQLAAGIALAAIVVNAAAGGSLPFDPAPYEMAYVRAVTSSHDDPAALAALNQAIALAPNSGELLMQRIALKRDRLHEPVADDIRRVLALDRANARVRLDLALPDTDLPAAERIAALQDALRFDRALAADEPKRLTAEQIQQVKQTIARLEQATRP